MDGDLSNLLVVLCFPTQVILRKVVLRSLWLRRLCCQIITVFAEEGYRARQELEFDLWANPNNWVLMCSYTQTLPLVLLIDNGGFILNIIAWTCKVNLLVQECETEWWVPAILLLHVLFSPKPHLPFGRHHLLQLPLRGSGRPLWVGGQMGLAQRTCFPYQGFRPPSYLFSYACVVEGDTHRGDFILFCRSSEKGWIPHGVSSQ